MIIIEINHLHLKESVAPPALPRRRRSQVELAAALIASKNMVQPATAELAWQWSTSDHDIVTIDGGVDDMYELSPLRLREALDVRFGCLV